jgi:polysaccharide biosynthesis/export protein
MNHHRYLFVLLGTLLALAAPHLSAQTPGSRPAPEKKNYVHTLSLADRIQVRVFQEEDLTSIARIDARGKINLPLLGEIAVGGMTVVEAQTAIENAYKDNRYLRNPQVTINVEEYAPREVSINGQVRNPGRYQLPNESTYTLSELVTKAGGVTDIGKSDAVTVTRIMPDGTKKVLTVDVDSILKGTKSKETDFVLQAGDNVFVRERLI